MKKQLSFLLMFSFLLFAPAMAQKVEKPVSVQVQGAIFKPAKKPATKESVKALKLPEGFEIKMFAEKLGKPRMLAVSDAGHVYVTRREGDVMLLKDNNNDGRADETKSVAKKENMHGITIHNSKMYLITVKEVYEADINKDGTLGELKMLINDLPDGGQHPNRTLAFGPDGKMYISVGSTCNACDEPNPENATMIVADADGSNRRVYAKGLRNTIGFGWHPETKEFWGMDHGIDWLGDNEQKEELNKISEGADYGWPYIYADGKFNPADEPEDMTYKEYAAKTTKPELLHLAHSAPMAMAFYTGAQFPREYLNDAFVALHGSWNRSTPVGYNVVRVKYENGKPIKFEDFLTGFISKNGQSYTGRPCGLAQHKDGSLYLSDDANGVIYRITYTGNQQQKGR